MKSDLSGGTLFVVGAGSGAPQLLTGQAKDIIADCGFIAGGRRLLERLTGLISADAERFEIGPNLSALVSFISRVIDKKDVCVVTSGDPGCFSVMPLLKKHFSGSLVVIPGISSVQMLAARLKMPWSGWTLASLHGRPGINHLKKIDRTTVFFCDDENTPQNVAQQLLIGMDGAPAAVGSCLGEPGEQIFQGMLDEVARTKFPGHALLLVSLGEGRTGLQAKQKQAWQAAASTGAGYGAEAPGIPDSRWLRQKNVPLSKSEVRVLVIAKARPRERRVIWDVGAGTGSYGIECSLLEPGAQVLSIDKNPAACHLVAANAERFGARVEVVCGAAPEALEALARPDLVIIGGSEGMLAPIFKAAVRALGSGGRLLVTALLDQTKKTAHALFAESELVDRTATRVAISRGEGHQWIEQNPVTIFTGDKPADKSGI